MSSRTRRFGVLVLVALLGLCGRHVQSASPSTMAIGAAALETGPNSRRSLGYMSNESSAPGVYPRVDPLFAAFGADSTKREKKYTPSLAVTSALFVSSLLSCLSCVLVFMSACRYKRLRRHPSGIIISRCIADFVFCFDICMSHVFPLIFGDDIDQDDKDCQVLSALSQMTGIAAELYVGALALDLIISLSNPFTNTKGNVRSYHIGVLGISALSALLLLTVKEDGHPIYGRDNFLDICWIRRYSDANGTNESVWFSLLFNVPLVVLYAFAFYSLVFVRVRLYRGLRETINERAEVLRNTGRFVVTYFCYWSLAAVVFLSISAVDNDHPPFSLSFVLAFALGGRGMVTGIVWVCIRDFRKAVKLHRLAKETKTRQATDLRPQINLALRKEVLYYTTLGIRKAVLFAQRVEQEWRHRAAAGGTGNESPSATGGSSGKDRGLIGIKGVPEPSDDDELWTWDWGRGFRSSEDGDNRQPDGFAAAGGGASGMDKHRAGRALPSPSGNTPTLGRGQSAGTALAGTGGPRTGTLGGVGVKFGPRPKLTLATCPVVRLVMPRKHEEDFARTQQRIYAARKRRQRERREKKRAQQITKQWRRHGALGVPGVDGGARLNEGLLGPENSAEARRHDHGRRGGGSRRNRHGGGRGDDEFASGLDHHRRHRHHRSHRGHRTPQFHPQSSHSPHRPDAHRSSAMRSLGATAGAAAGVGSGAGRLPGLLGSPGGAADLVLGGARSRAVSSAQRQSALRRNKSSFGSYGKLHSLGGGSTDAPGSGARGSAGRAEIGSPLKHHSSNPGGHGVSAEMPGLLLAGSPNTSAGHAEGLAIHSGISGGALPTVSDPVTIPSPIGSSSNRGRMMGDTSSRRRRRSGAGAGVIDAQDDEGSDLGAALASVGSEDAVMHAAADDAIVRRGSINDSSLDGTDDGGGAGILLGRNRRDASGDSALISQSVSPGQSQLHRGGRIRSGESNTSGMGSRRSGRGGERRSGGDGSIRNDASGRSRGGDVDGNDFDSAMSQAGSASTVLFGELEADEADMAADLAAIERADGWGEDGEGQAEAEDLVAMLETGRGGDEDDDGSVGVGAQGASATHGDDDGDRVAWGQQAGAGALTSGETADMMAGRLRHAKIATHTRDSRNTDDDDDDEQDDHDGLGLSMDTPGVGTRDTAEGLQHYGRQRSHGSSSRKRQMRRQLGWADAWGGGDAFDHQDREDALSDAASSGGSSSRSSLSWHGGNTAKLRRRGRDSTEQTDGGRVPSAAGGGLAATEDRLPTSASTQALHPDMPVTTSDGATGDAVRSHRRGQTTLGSSQSHPLGFEGILPKCDEDSELPAPSPIASRHHHHQSGTAPRRWAPLEQGGRAVQTGKLAVLGASDAKELRAPGIAAASAAPVVAAASAAPPVSGAFGVAGGRTEESPGPALLLSSSVRSAATRGQAAANDPLHISVPGASAARKRDGPGVFEVEGYARSGHGLPRHTQVVVRGGGGAGESSRRGPSPDLFARGSSVSSSSKQSRTITLREARRRGKGPAGETSTVSGAGTGRGGSKIGSRLTGAETSCERLVHGCLLTYMTCGFNCGVKDHDEFVFFDFAPHLFRRVRRMSSISNFEYARALQSTKREKFSEGASGAFLYFSDDERFIVKTTQLDEISVLIEMLEEYVEHLERNPNSLVTRFLGCHAIRMYGHTMYFVVINNVLTSHGKSIHERYDLKGSWVNRHHKPTMRGRMTECRHCNQKFRVGDPKAQCPARVNRSHAPNTVMKDNDLKTKLRIHPSTAAAIAEQISRDCRFLESQDIMDYSLLLGVHRSKYALMVLAPGMGTITHVHPHTHDDGDPATNHWHSHGPGIEAHHHPAQQPRTMPASSAAQGGLGFPVSQLSGTMLLPTQHSTALPANHFPAVVRQASAESGVAMVSYSEPPSKGPLSRIKGRGGTASTMTRPDSMNSLSAANGAAITGVFREVEDASRPGGHSRRRSKHHLRIDSRTGTHHRASTPGISPTAASGGGGHGMIDHTAGHTEGGAAMLVLLDDSPKLSGMQYPTAAGNTSAASSGSAGATGGIVPASAAGMGIGAASGMAMPQPLVLPSAATAASAVSGAGAGLVSVGVAVPDAEDNRSVEDDSWAAADKAAHRTAVALWSGADGSAVPASPGLLGAVGVDLADHSRALRAGTSGGVPASSYGGHAIRAHHARSEGVSRTPRGVIHSPSAANGPDSSVDSSRRNSGTNEAHAGGDVSNLSPLELQQLAGGMLVKPGLFTAYRGGLQAQVVEGPGIYFMGLIDVLQRYTCQKRMERFIKTRIMCRSTKGISAVPPAPYARRFERRVVDQLFQEYHGEFYELHNDEEEDEAAAWVAVPSCWSSLCLRLCCISNDE